MAQQTQRSTNSSTNSSCSSCSSSRISNPLRSAQRVPQWQHRVCSVHPKLPMRQSVPIRCLLGESSSHITSHHDQQQLLPPELRDFRANAGVCLVNSQGLVFAATRTNDPAKTWQMPQGGIDPGESPRQAAIRELQEETSVCSVELLADIPHWIPYEFPPEVRSRLGPSWAHFRGQAQRWFLLRFTGNDREINLDTPHKEFSSWRWMPLGELPGAVIGFKRGVYEAVAAEFAPAVDAIAAAAAAKQDGQQNINGET